MVATSTLLCALWIRSFRVKDIVWAPWSETHLMRIASLDGRLVVSFKPARFSSPWSWTQTTPKSLGTGYPDASGKTPNSWWFGIFRWNSGSIEYHTPLWAPLVLLAALTCLLVRKQRYSVRTLLSIVTLAALVLGIAACSTPPPPETFP
jgi:hypothetical protein